MSKNRYMLEVLLFAIITIYMRLEFFSPKPKENKVESKDSYMDKLFGLQLQYCTRVYQGKIPNAFDGKKYIPPDPFYKEKGEPVFKNIFLNCSNLEGEIYASYCRRTATPIEVKNEKDLADYKNHDLKFAMYENILMKKIFQSYNSVPQNQEALIKWMSSIPVMIGEHEKTLPPPTKEATEQCAKRMKEIEKMQNRDTSQVGLVKYEIRQMSGTPQELKEQGIKDGDIIAKLHFESPFDKGIKQEGEFKKVFSLEFIKKLAINMYMKNPNIKMITADSWILDTPIAQKIGFKYFKNHSSNMTMTSGGFWGQFVDSKGEIKKDLAKEFLQTGIPPHIPKLGYILASDLKRKLFGG